MEVRDKGWSPSVFWDNALKSWPFRYGRAEWSCGSVKSTGHAHCTVWTNNEESVLKQIPAEILVCLTRSYTNYVTISVWSFAYSLTSMASKSLPSLSHLHLLAHQVTHTAGNSSEASSWRLLQRCSINCADVVNIILHISSPHLLAIYNITASLTRRK